MSASPRSARSFLALLTLLRSSLLRSSPPEALLRPWFALLGLASGVAVLQVLLLPSWPRASELHQASLQQALARAGLTVSPLPSRPAERRQEQAFSSQLGWTIAPGAQLWIVNGAVRRYEDLQIAFLTRHRPALRLQGRQLDRPMPASVSGVIQGHPAVQTCLVPQHEGPAMPGVTRTALLRASDPRRQLQGLRDPLTLAGRLLGLLQPRAFACVLVTLRSADGAPLPPRLWPRLLPALQSALSLPSAAVIPDRNPVPARPQRP
jgi:hypothetical protein